MRSAQLRPHHASLPCVHVGGAAAHALGHGPGQLASSLDVAEAHNQRADVVVAAARQRLVRQLLGRLLSVLDAADEVRRLLQAATHAQHPQWSQQMAPPKRSVCTWCSQFSASS